MKAIDAATALGIAALVFVLDLGCAFIAVWLWSLLIEPDHPSSYYTAAAPRIATVSTRLIGPLLLVGSVWIFSRRRPDRNPFVFALVTFLFYVLLDGGSVAFSGFFTWAVLVTMTLKLTGAMIGALLARRVPKAA